jgi:hypothetical protein
MRSNSELLDELARVVAALPRQRLHVHPDSVMWIVHSVQYAGLGQHVEVVADPACPEVGLGWIETLTIEQWRALRALVGRRVTVATAERGKFTGRLVALDHSEALLDPGGGIRGIPRRLPWLAIEPASADAQLRGAIAAEG